MTADTLEERLEQFDGRATTLLSEARMASRECDGFLENLVELGLDPRPTVSAGATWILRLELEAGAALAPELTDRLVQSLDHVQSWQARLHICQMVDRLVLNEDQASLLIAWARPLRSSQRPFVRAWSAHLTVMLGMRFPAFRQEGERSLAAAEADSAASVRARARRVKDAIRKGAGGLS